MTQSDYKRFFHALTVLADYYGKALSEGSMLLYRQGLQGYEIEQIEKAIGIHVQNPDSGQWMPKIADIVRMIEGTTQDAAAIAWAKVMRAVGSVGQYQSLAFDDPIIHLVIGDLGSWPSLCQTSEEELPFLAKRFEISYRAYKRRSDDIPVHPRYLVGVSEMQNAGQGFRSDPPRLVGDQEKARRVMLGGTDKARLQVSGAGDRAAAEVLRLVRPVEAA